MINFILPENVGSSVNLEDAIAQSQTLFYNNTLVQKHTNIIYSRDVIFFYVDRTAHFMSHNQFNPYYIQSLPVAMAGFERLNDTSVQIPDEITIKKDTFALRSIVISLINDNIDVATHKIIIGSATLVKMVVSDRTGFMPYTIVYNPLNMRETVGLNSNKISPITIPAEDDPLVATKMTATIEKQGVIYMYQKQSSADAE